MTPGARSGLARSRRWVVKLGSGVLSAGTDRLDAATLGRVASDVASLRERRREVVLVSSGAILAGAERLALKTRPRTTQLKQAAAAVGQSRLMRAWEEAFARRDLAVAQVLLTREDLRDRGRFLNARNTLFELLRLGVVPIINENDTVAVDEIKFGDNDGLSALVASLCDADLLVLLTDQPGLFTADPRKDSGAEFVAEFDAASLPDFGKAGPSGSGGMESKVRAARTAAAAGITAVIAGGLEKGTLERIGEGEAVGTLFAPRAAPLDKRRQWLAFATHPKGQIHVDAGAREALVKSAKSLLPSGVKDVAGAFAAGDVVSLVADGAEFARGLCNFAAEDLKKVKGLKTTQIEQVLGHKPSDEVVHRDNLAIL